ncbi:hypothetical protein ONS95_012382 [Cadophora gregata]|uniref:uncharacterized protein n=1 Tax=Cadophora gregata TaxID=51156 RepID=UPI0026DCCB42|nr:uncharacterized protein ONS95_012382 [Cadophora gregata]KAK0118074.1 hypothetical protein ONS95_012382 [Cadophora gregata]KAK0123142.1 hypothetical protein ONS96_010146 [Cadophora gregata f. sp. sojae]
MKSSFGFAALFAMAATVVVAQDGDACEADIPTGVKAASVTTASSSSVNMVPVLSDVNPSTNSTKLYVPSKRPRFDRHNPKNVVPSKNTSCYYSANSTSGSMVVNNTMKYPTVVLEDIASIINVDCTADSVAVTFNDTATFAKAQSVWASKSNASMVLITNHLGDCDAELERSYFLTNSISFDDETLVATASTQAANISTVATYTTISFGNIEAAVANATNDKRALVVDPKYTFSPSIALAEDTVLFEYDPYVTITADNASFSSDITFSGYLAYNWWLWKLEAFYFDIDADFKADLGLSADVKASYETAFSYAPASLYYGVSVPGVLELGPMLQFSVGTEIGVSAAAQLSTAFEVALANGNVHLDVLDSKKTSVSGWTPTYSAGADINGQVKAYLNPSASLTVEIAAKAFGGLIDLSTGLTAKPGFDNSFALTGGVGVDLGGLQNITNGASCTQGLQLNSNFTFALDAFATQWYSANLYEVAVPLLDKCYSWA